MQAFGQGAICAHFLKLIFLLLLRLSLLINVFKIIFIIIIIIITSYSFWTVRRWVPLVRNRLTRPWNYRAWVLNQTLTKADLLENYKIRLNFNAWLNPELLVVRHHHEHCCWLACVSVELDGDWLPLWCWGISPHFVWSWSQMKVTKIMMIWLHLLLHRL